MATSWGVYLHTAAAVGVCGLVGWLFRTWGGEANIVGSDENDTEAHMRNFFDCVRSRMEPNCPFELGYSSAIACQMAIASLRQGRTVQWDAEREDII